MSSQTQTMRAKAAAKGLNLSPNFGSLPARLNGMGGVAAAPGGRALGRLGTTDLDALGISPALYYGISYASSFLGGAGVGYVVARNGKGAVTGGLASSGFWAGVEGIRGARMSSPFITAGLLGVSGVSLWLAWKRK